LGSLSAVHRVYEYFLELEELKFARNALTNYNFYNKTFLEYDLLLFASESHQVVKITLTY
jgi:hypothetical protein